MPLPESADEAGAAGGETACYPCGETVDPAARWRACHDEVGRIKKILVSGAFWAQVTRLGADWIEQGNEYDSDQGQPLLPVGK